MAKEMQRVHFKLTAMGCCGQLLCWVNPRPPNYCPECGKYCFPEVKGWVTFDDNNAKLTYTVEK